MSNPYLGEIRMFGGNFAPYQWALCNGQLLSISQYSALFSLIGTSYGGDGVTTFGLPNLQGRLPAGQGNGGGLTPRTIGEIGGTENVTLTLQQIPAHNHTFQASAAGASATMPGSSVLPAHPSPANGHFFTVNDGTSPPPTINALKATSCGPSGGNQPHSNLMPSLCVTFIISLSGIFPSRN